jgi:hypothetical protein
VEKSAKREAGQIFSPDFSELKTADADRENTY